MWHCLIFLDSGTHISVVDVIDGDPHRLHFLAQRQADCSYALSAFYQLYNIYYHLINQVDHHTVQNGAKWDECSRNESNFPRE